MAEEKKEYLAIWVWDEDKKAYKIDRMIPFPLKPEKAEFNEV